MEEDCEDDGLFASCDDEDTDVDVDVDLGCRIFSRNDLTCCRSSSGALLLKMEVKPNWAASSLMFFSFAKVGGGWIRSNGSAGLFRAMIRAMVQLARTINSSIVLCTSICSFPCTSTGSPSPVNLNFNSPPAPWERSNEPFTVRHPFNARPNAVSNFKSFRSGSHRSFDTG